MQQQSFLWLYCRTKGSPDFKNLLSYFHVLLILCRIKALFKKHKSTTTYSGKMVLYAGSGLSTAAVSGALWSWLLVFWRSGYTKKWGFWHTGLHSLIKKLILCLGLSCQGRLCFPWGPWEWAQLCLLVLRAGFMTASLGNHREYLIILSRWRHIPQLGKLLFKAVRHLRAENCALSLCSTSRILHCEWELCLHSRTKELS